MKSKSPSHSFIIRIWWEQRENTADAPVWRGVIEHISSGEKRYFIKLEEIIPFILHHINSINPTDSTRNRPEGKP
jgi:hypothetical protein